MKRWQEFERLASRIYTELSPQARVILNDRIKGKSGVVRQIDVSIRATIAGHDILVVIDTKDLQQPADIGLVDEFAGKIQDVRANKGILICSGGFTSGARLSARGRGIDVCNLHDAQNRDWHLEVKLPILWIDLKPKVSFRMEAHFEAGDNFENDPSFWRITPDGGETLLKLLSTFESRWNNGSIPRSAGTLHTIQYPQQNLQIRVKDSKGNNEWRPIRDLKFAYTVSQEAWLGYFTPAECRGVLHYLDGRFEASYLPIGTIPRQRDENWVRVKDPTNLVVSIPGTIVTTEGWQVDVGSGKFTDVDIALKE